jgi:DNA-binding PadR family transcriptional regulator
MLQTKEKGTDFSVPSQRLNNDIISDTEQFSKVLFANKNKKDFIELRLFSRDMSEVVEQIFFESVEDLLCYVPPDNLNIRLSIFTRDRKNGKSQFAVNTGAIYADYDNLTLEEVKERINKVNLPYPSIIVSSGRGYHVYWKLYNRAGKETIPVLEVLARRTGADMQQAGLKAGSRLPGTYNTKYKPVAKVEIIEINNNEYQLDFIASALGVQAIEPAKRELVTNVDRPCIQSILQGVPAGQRNFALGRLTKYLQWRGISERESKKIISEWNERNNPPEKSNKLNDFKAYWKGDYKLLGCSIDNAELQQMLSSHCKRDICPVGNRIDRIDLSNSIDYNNRLVKKLRGVSAKALLVYGVLTIYPQGLNTDQLEDRANISHITRKQAIKELESEGYIDIQEGIKRRGIKDFYRIKRQGTFGTGRTIVSNGAVNGAVYKIITLEQFKLYVLLNYYAWSNKPVYPSLETLGKELKKDRKTISYFIKQLENANYIEILRDYNQKAVVKNYYRLLI